MRIKFHQSDTAEYSPDWNDYQFLDFCYYTYFFGIRWYPQKTAVRPFKDYISL